MLTALFYLQNRLNEINCDVEFEDGGEFIDIYVKQYNMTVAYRLWNETYYLYIFNASFTNFQELYELEKKLEPIINEFVEIKKYLKIERKA